MSKAPKLIGMIVLPWPRVRKAVGAAKRTGEIILRVAVDEDGQQWGLVERRTPLPGYDNMAHVDYVRWVRFEALPFVETEVITADSWDVGIAERGDS